jgi:hypothetical protein
VIDARPTTTPGDLDQKGNSIEKTGAKAAAMR